MLTYSGLFCPCEEGQIWMSFAMVGGQCFLNTVSYKSYSVDIKAITFDQHMSVILSIILHILYISPLSF